MKVLFVCSGNKTNGISPIVYNQGETLKKENIDITYFTIKGRGLRGYLKNIFVLKTYLKKYKYDLIHSHYSLSSIVTTLSFPKIPQVVSLMGSDSKMNILWILIIKYLAYFSWSAVIVKSESIQKDLALSNSYIIPNGIELEKFQPIYKTTAKQLLGLNLNKKYIVFIANPSRYEKNFELASKAIRILNNPELVLYIVYGKPHNEIVKYIYSSELLLLTSFWEGSPNVIKEAMACNLPIVSTDVGDVSWLIKDVQGCYLTSFDPEDIAEKIKLALAFVTKVGRTNGRERIIKLGLDSVTIAKKIIEIYKKVLENH